MQPIHSLEGFIWSAYIDEKRGIGGSVAKCGAKNGLILLCHVATCYRFIEIATCLRASLIMQIIISLLPTIVPLCNTQRKEPEFDPISERISHACIIRFQPTRGHLEEVQFFIKKKHVPDSLTSFFFQTA